MPYRLSGNDDEDNDDHGANNLILGGNFSTLRSKQDHACVEEIFRFLHSYVLLTIVRILGALYLKDGQGYQSRFNVHTFSEKVTCNTIEYNWTTVGTQFPAHSI